MIEVKESEVSEDTQLDDIIKWVLQRSPNAKKFWVTFDKFDTIVMITGIKYEMSFKEFKNYMIRKMLEKGIYLYTNNWKFQISHNWHNLN